MFDAPTVPAGRSVRTRPALLVLFAPFLCLAALFASADLMTLRRVSGLRTQTETVVHDMLVDLDRVAIMGRNLDRIQLLGQQHVYEKETPAMVALEAGIASSWADFDRAAAAFASDPLLPLEQAPWDSLKTQIADVRPGLDRSLEPSRRNDDVVAGERLVALQPAFDLAKRDLRALRDVNRALADEAVTDAAALQTSATRGMQLLAVTGVGISLATGLWLVFAQKRRADVASSKAKTLEASNRELDAFAGRVAHDLRNPLSTASLAVALLSKQAITPEQQKNHAVLRRSFDRMNALIEDLLAISRAQATLTVVVCDPVLAAEKLREELAPRIQDSGVNLMVDVRAAQVRCTEGLLWQVLWNLTDNAIKYCKSGVRPIIEVRGSPVDGQYELSVKDNGVGIAPAEAAKVFEPFYRVDAERGSRAPGSVSPSSSAPSRPTAARSASSPSSAAGPASSCACPSCYLRAARALAEARPFPPVRLRSSGDSAAGPRRRSRPAAVRSRR